MNAYVHGELPAHVRRRMARHIHQCADCYPVYRRELALKHELEARLPGFGGSNRPQLAHLWSNIQGELTAPTRTPRVARQSILRHTLVAAILVLGMLLPMTIYGQTLTVSVPTQPAPALIGDTRVDETRPVPLGTSVAAHSASAETLMSSVATAAASTPTPGISPGLIPVPGTPRE